MEKKDRPAPKFFWLKIILTLGLLFALGIAIGLYAIGAFDKPKPDLTFEELLWQNSLYIEGEYAKAYQFQDGGLSVMDIQKLDTFTALDQTFNNVVLFDLYCDPTLTTAFFKGEGRYRIFDVKGEKIPGPGASTYYDPASDKFYLIVYNISDMQAVKYVGLGGFCSKNSPFYYVFYDMDNLPELPDWL